MEAVTNTTMRPARGVFKRRFLCLTLCKSSRKSKKIETCKCGTKKSETTANDAWCRWIRPFDPAATWLLAAGGAPSHANRLFVPHLAKLG